MVNISFAYSLYFKQWENVMRKYQRCNNLCRKNCESNEWIICRLNLLCSAAILKQVEQFIFYIKREKYCKPMFRTLHVGVHLIHRAHEERSTTEHPSHDHPGRQVRKFPAWLKSYYVSSTSPSERFSRQLPIPRQLPLRSSIPLPVHYVDYRCVTIFLRQK